METNKELSEREAFESAVGKLGKWLMSRNPDGTYQEITMRGFWSVWQAALAASQAAPASAAVVLEDIEDPVIVPRGLLGAACSAIDKKRDAPTVLAKLRRYTTGAMSALAQRAGSGEERCAMNIDRKTAIALAIRCGASHYRKFTGVEGIQFEGGSLAKFVRALTASTSQPDSERDAALTDEQIESLREIGQSWMSESGRDALEDWIASMAAQQGEKGGAK